MAPSTRTTRRGLLRALGGAGAGGVATGTVAAGGGRGRGRGGGRGRSGGAGGGRETHSDRGIVVQFEDCRTAHVRGSRNKVDEIVVLYDTCSPDPGDCPAGHRKVIREFDLPLTIDRGLLGLSGDNYRIGVVQYSGSDMFGGVTPPGDCTFDSEE